MPRAALKMHRYSTYTGQAGLRQSGYAPGLQIIHPSDIAKPTVFARQTAANRRIKITCFTGEKVSASI